MGLSYLKLFFDQIKAMEPYSDEEAGRIVRAMARYAEFGEEPAFQGNERFIWPMLKDVIDRSTEKYEELCAVRKECGSKGGRPKKPKGFSENQMVIEKPKGFSENQMVIEKPKGFSENQKNLREEEEQEEDQEEEPPPPTPSRGEKPKNPPLFPESEKSNRNGGGGSGFDDILLTAGNRQELIDFLSSGLTMEVVQHAVDEAAANGQKKWSYVRGILNRYKREGIKTVDQARASDGKRTLGVSSEELQRKRREEARTLARLRGELPADKPNKRKEKYTAVVKGELVEFERDVVT